VTTSLRAAVVGLGMMGRNHVRVLRGLDGVDLVGVVDPLGDKYASADDLDVHTQLGPLLDAGLDLAVVAAPTADHVELGLLLAEAGVHTMIEKPLAPTLTEARTLADAFESRGLVGAVGHIERFNPAIRALRDHLAADELGEVFQIATRRQGPFPDRVRDVGVILDLATHDVDLTAWIAGSPYRSIAARTAFRTGRPHEDLVAATGVLVDGTVTNHLVNWLTPTKERFTVVTGDKGMFVADTINATLTFYANGSETMEWDTMQAFHGVSEGDVIRYAIPKPEPLVVEHQAFRDAVRGDGDAQIVTMRDGFAAVRVAEATLRSARTGTTVDLEGDLA